jgi:hypothetical protein
MNTIQKPIRLLGNAVKRRNNDDEPPMNLSQIISVFDESATDTWTASNYISNVDAVFKDMYYKYSNYIGYTEYDNASEFTLKNLTFANGSGVLWFVRYNDVCD